jgi:DNA-binding MarR family transcriptional regulator
MSLRLSTPRSPRTSPTPSNGNGHARLDLDAFMPYRLSVLSNRVSSAIADEYSERFDLTIPEWRVMAVLGGSPGLSAREVAERTAMDKVQVSRAVARLLSKRRIARETDGEDGRVTRLSLSPKGRAIYDEIVPLALHLEEEFLSVLNETERKSFEALMNKLSVQARRI